MSDPQQPGDAGPGGTGPAAGAGPDASAGAERPHRPVYRTGAEQPWDPEDLTAAKGQDPTPANLARSARELAEEGPAAIERIVP